MEDTNKVITKCGHKFCVECYTRAARNKNDCAVCRTKLCSIEPENWKRRYEEMEQDCEYYRNIVERVTSVLSPHIQGTDSIQGDSDMELDEDDNSSDDDERARSAIDRSLAYAISNGQRV